MISKGKKATGPYPTLKVKEGKQKFGPVELPWQHKFVVLSPVLNVGFAHLGPEGNFIKLGKDMGPTSIDGLKYELTLTNESYSKKVSDKEFTNPVANAFFDFLDNFQTWWTTTIFNAGGFTDFKDFINNKIKESNKEGKDKMAKKLETAKKGKDKFDPADFVFEDELPPQTDEEWLELLRSAYTNPITKNDSGKGVRSISVNRSIYDKLRKDKSGKIIGDDVNYVPPPSEHGVFIEMFNKDKPVNDKDMQRKQHKMVWYRPFTSEENQDATPDKKAFPYVQIDAPACPVDTEVKALISLNPYDWVSSKAGTTRTLLGLVYIGQKGELDDSPPVECNPLKCMPMATGKQPAISGASAPAVSSSFADFDVDEDAAMAAAVDAAEAGAKFAAAQ